ncbi:hypothetical protein TDSAC_0528 [Thermodesulfobium acidiphilum]|uniref:Uncharacterized protein n=1 Tax=Thermodesulfobium acidiphilum TaxID=1794699 RepID=A0A2R4VZH0_THEAF|nr:hypothetical protein [Thermodesulfobium acidiphilum]AWB09902.1 hypothetical protein TDSAC_0528 [Thermodesulfobium acidiphilum]
MEKIDIIKKNLKKVVEEKIQKMPIYSWIDSFYDIFISWEEFFEILKKYDDKALFSISEFSGEELKNIEEEVVKISIEGLKCRIRKEIEKELQSVERFWIIVDKEGLKLPRFIVYDDGEKKKKDFNVFDCLRAYGLKPDGNEVWEDVAKSILYSRENREEWDLDLYATYLEAEDQGLNEVQSCSTKYMDIV